MGASGLQQNTHSCEQAHLNRLRTCSTFTLVFAELSMYLTPHERARACASSCFTCRRSERSALLPTRIIGTDVFAPPLASSPPFMRRMCSLHAHREKRAFEFREWIPFEAGGTRQRDQVKLFVSVLLQIHSNSRHIRTSIVSSYLAMQQHA